MAEKPLSPRMELFNDIERSRAEQVNAELAELGSEERVEVELTPEITKPSGKDATDNPVLTDDDDTDGGEKPAPKVEDAPIYDFLGEEKLSTTKVKTKVDGVEQELSVADLVRGHQKSAAADKRLEDASIAKRQAEQVLADARVQAEQITAAAKTAATNSNTGDAGKEKTEVPSGKDAIQSAMSLIYEGDQEKAAGILDAEINRRVEAKAASATVDPERTADEVEERVSWKQAISAFNRDHADIVQDPAAAMLYQRHLNQIWAVGGVTPEEAMTQALAAVEEADQRAAERVSKRTGDAGKGGLKVDDEALAQRNADKAKASQVRSNSSIRSQSTATQEDVYDPAAVVAEMKKARGQS